MSNFLKTGVSGLMLCTGEAPESVNIYDLHERYVKYLSNERRGQYAAVLCNTGLDAMRVMNETGAFVGISDDGTVLDDEIMRTLLMPDRIISNVYPTKTAACADVYNKYKDALAYAQQRYQRLNVCA